MRTLGIVGGIGPPSTIEYYGSIIEIYRQRTGGRYPRLLINSIDAAACWELVAADRRDELATYLQKEVSRLVSAGAELCLFASNTVHVVFDRLHARSPIPLVSILEAVGEAAAGFRRLGLFATWPTVRAKLYPSALDPLGIGVITPAKDDQRLIDQVYMEQLVKGRFLPETRLQLLDIADRLRSTHDVEGIILGGTEFPLLLSQETWNGLRFLNSTRIHAEAAVAQMLH